MCSEFTCLPSAAVQELDEGDAALVFTILTMRGYALTKQQVDGAGSRADLKMTPMMEAVLLNELALLQEPD